MLKDMTKKSGGDLKKLQVSSGDHVGILASTEDNASVLQMKGGIRKGSQGGRRVQSAPRCQKVAVGHEVGLSRCDDSRSRVLRLKERQRAALGHRAKVKAFQQRTDVPRG